MLIEPDDDEGVVDERDDIMNNADSDKSDEEPFSESDADEEHLIRASDF